MPHQIIFMDVNGESWFFDNDIVDRQHLSRLKKIHEAFITVIFGFAIPELAALQLFTADGEKS